MSAEVYKVECLESAEVFLEKALPFLLENESSNFQCIGAACTGQFGGPCSFLIVSQSQAIAFAAVLVPNRLLMSKGPAEAVALFVKTAFDNNKRIPAVKAHEGTVELLSKELSERNIVEEQPPQEIGYVMDVTLETIASDLKIPAGHLREATFAEDLDTFVTCHEQELSDANRAKITEEAMAGMYFWCDQDAMVVSVAKYVMFSDSIAVVRGVYTPAYGRGKGYGTAVTYGLTEFLLKEKGVKKVILSVVRENGSAIKVYQKCGYVVGQETKMVRYKHARS